MKAVAVPARGLQGMPRVVAATLRDFLNDCHATRHGQIGHCSGGPPSTIRYLYLALYPAPCGRYSDRVLATELAYSYSLIPRVWVD